jgi:hypothetical protein
MAKCEWYCEYYKVDKTNNGFTHWCNATGQKITEIMTDTPEIYKDCPKFVQGRHYSKQRVKLDNEIETK